MARLLIGTRWRQTHVSEAEPHLSGDDADVVIHSSSQCARRSLHCEYPTEFRKGKRKKKTTIVVTMAPISLLSRGSSVVLETHFSKQDT